MAQLVYRAHVTDAKGRTQKHDLVIGGGHMTAEEVAEHLNETGHFDKHRPTKIVLEPDPIGEVEETVAQVINRRGKMAIHRVAEVAPRPEEKTKAEVADVDLERKGKTPTIVIPITDSAEGTDNQLPAPLETTVDLEPESPVAEVATAVVGEVSAEDKKT